MCGWTTLCFEQVSLQAIGSNGKASRFNTIVDHDVKVQRHSSKQNQGVVELKES
jgi:hypothetical protein